jgi:K+-transporting ATPase KdpF subunit
MKTKLTNSLLSLSIVPAGTSAAGTGNNLSYLLGGIIALFIMGYLIYTLMHPDKF